MSEAAWVDESEASRIESYSLRKEPVVRTTRQLSITLPNDMADALRERVRAGEYASESEVIREGCARSGRATTRSRHGCVMR